MVSIKNVLFFIAAASAAVLPRDAALDQKHLNIINSDVGKLITAVNNYQSGWMQALPTLTAANTLGDDLGTATKEIKAAAPITSDTDALGLLNYINNTLEPNVSKCISAFIAKKANIAKDNLTSITLSKLKELRDDTTSFGNVLVSSAPASKTAACQAALNKILADFDTGIKAFSS